MFRTLSRKALLVAIFYLALALFVATLVIVNTVHNQLIVSHLTSVTLQHIDLNGHFSNDLNRAVAEAASYARNREDDDRAEAQEALEEAHVHLTQLNAMAQQPGLLAAERDVIDELDARRATLLAGIEGGVNGLLVALDRRDEVGVDQALDALNELEDETETIHHTADEYLEAEASAVAATFRTEMRRSRVGIAIMISVVVLITVAIFLVVRRRVAQPLALLARAAGGVAHGRLDQTVAVTHRDEIGVLQQAFNQMVANLRAQQATVEERGLEIQRQLEAQQRLFATVQDLSTPLLPIWDGLVVLPLVGHVDTQRAAAVMQTLLEGVAKRRARVAIMDVTGVAVLDTHVVKLLMQAIQATELLGARVMLAGITAPMAQVVVTQGLDLGSLQTFRDLRSAIEAALPYIAVQFGGDALPA